LFDIVNVSVLGDLNFEATFPKSQFKDFADLSVTLFRREIEFCNLVLSRYAKVHVPFGNKSRNISRRQKNQCERVILDKRYV
jgi:hypothetical protein